MAPSDEPEAITAFGLPSTLIPELPPSGEAIQVFRETLPAGQVFCRCHDRRWSGNSFNSGRELTSNAFLFYGDRLALTHLTVMHESPGLFTAPEAVEEIINMADRLGLCLATPDL